MRTKHVETEEARARRVELAKARNAESEKARQHFDKVYAADKRRAKLAGVDKLPPT